MKPPPLMAWIDDGTSCPKSSNTCGKHTPTKLKRDASEDTEFQKHPSNMKPTMGKLATKEAKIRYNASPRAAQHHGVSLTCSDIRSCFSSAKTLYCAAANTGNTAAKPIMSHVAKDQSGMELSALLVAVVTFAVPVEVTPVLLALMPALS